MQARWDGRKDNLTRLDKTQTIRVPGWTIDESNLGRGKFECGARFWGSGHMNQALDAMSSFPRHIWKINPYDSKDHKEVESMV